MKKKLSNLKSTYLLVIMIIICVGLILATLTSNIVSSPVRNAFGLIVTPFQNGINRVGTAITDQWSGFNDVKELTKLTEELQKQIDELTEENNALVQSQLELERLEALYQLDQEYPQYQKVGAEVISKEPGSWYSTFIVNKGRDDGISVDMNVMAQGGLIGIVTEVGSNWAEVRSIIDDTSNVSAMAAGTSEPCVVSGNLLSMESGHIDFTGLRDKDNVVTEGTSIVTSNISDKYLTGLLIGYVGEISMDSNNLTKSGTIIPVADFRSLREVLIITDLKETKDTDDTSED